MMNWKMNDRLVDETGRVGKLITMPIAPSTFGVVLYDDDSHGRLIDLAGCRRLEEVEA